MEETFAAKLIHAVVFVIICATILILGWQEPLRYRFMSPQEIAELENPTPPPTPAPTPRWIDVQKVPTKLGEPAQSPQGTMRLHK